MKNFDLLQRELEPLGAEKRLEFILRDILEENIRGYKGPFLNLFLGELKVLEEAGKRKPVFVNISTILGKDLPWVPYMAKEDLLNFGYRMPEELMVPCPDPSEEEWEGAGEEGNWVFTCALGSLASPEELLVRRESIPLRRLVEEPKGINIFGEFKSLKSIPQKGSSRAPKGEEILEAILKKNFAKELHDAIREYLYPSDFQAYLESKEEFRDFVQKRESVENLRRMEENLIQKTQEMGEELEKLQDLGKRMDEELSGVDKRLSDGKGALEKMRQEMEDLEENISATGQRKQELEQQMGALRHVARLHGWTGVRRESQALKLSPKANVLKIIKDRLEYSYMDDLLISFLMGLGTNQLITLYGKPGTGKTTFVLKAAKALGARCTMISVQNNWTDSSDLLGYYSPIHQTYESTEFIEALLEANSDYLRLKENSPLHIICLDEMNLARVEYYFAYFLSLLQMDEEHQYIRLLPRYVQERIEKLEEPDFVRGREASENTKSATEPSRHVESAFLEEEKESQKEGEEGEGGSALEENGLSSLARYRDFPFPPNVRFVGTINYDDTTNALSPKVIDRSLYLEVKAQMNSSLSQGKAEPSHFPLSFFAPVLWKDPIDVFSRENARFQAYARQMYSMFQKVSPGGKSNEESKDFCDLVILSKVLPGLHRKKDYGYREGAYRRAEQALGEISLGDEEYFDFLGGEA